MSHWRNLIIFKILWYDLVLVHFKFYILVKSLLDHTLLCNFIFQNFMWKILKSNAFFLMHYFPLLTHFWVLLILDILEFCFLPVTVSSDYLLSVFFSWLFTFIPQISSSDAPLQPLVASPSLQAAVEKNKLEVW